VSSSLLATAVSVAGGRGCCEAFSSAPSEGVSTAGDSRGGALVRRRFSEGPIDEIGISSNPFPEINVEARERQQSMMTTTFDVYLFILATSAAVNRGGRAAAHVTISAYRNDLFFTLPSKFSYKSWIKSAFRPFLTVDAEDGAN
jgi:hypothetical protein